MQQRILNLLGKKNDGTLKSFLRIFGYIHCLAFKSMHRIQEYVQKYVKKRECVQQYVEMHEQVQKYAYECVQKYK